jgi:hypothetical protein
MFGARVLALSFAAVLIGGAHAMEQQSIQPRELKPLGEVPFMTDSDDEIEENPEDDGMLILEAFQLCGCQFRLPGGICGSSHCAVGLVGNNGSRANPSDAVRFYIAEYMDTALGPRAFVEKAPRILAFDEARNRELMRAFVNSSDTLRSHFCSEDPFFAPLCTDGSAALSSDEEKLIARRLMQASSIYSIHRPVPRNSAEEEMFENFMGADGEKSQDSFLQERGYHGQKEEEESSTGPRCEGLYCHKSIDVAFTAKGRPIFYQSGCKREGVMSCREQCPGFPTDPFNKGEHICRSQRFEGPWVLNHRRAAQRVLKDEVKHREKKTSLRGNTIKGGAPPTLGNVKEWMREYQWQNPVYSLTDVNCQKMVKFLLEAITHEVFPMHQQKLLAVGRVVGGTLGRALGGASRSAKSTYDSVSGPPIEFYPDYS